ncbi:MAG: glycosyltransferase family 4 protein [Caldilineales bacterium]|nr:glycosyltransferase family 4 protein [Caldilineales bacterium]
MNQPRTAFLHYSASPVVGGVEAVMDAHARVFLQEGYPVSIISGRGAAEVLPAGVDFIAIPEMDSRHPQIMAASAQLERGEAPLAWEALVDSLAEQLTSALRDIDNIIVHNVFTKHFNLPLTTALFRLIDAGVIPHCIAWCHDLTWTSPNSRHKVFPGQPWDLLRTFHEKLTYVVVSQQRQAELAGLLGCPQDRIHVIYNGVDPVGQLGLTSTGWALISRLGLLDAGLVLLMPVRVTQAKNIEYAIRVVEALKEVGARPKLVLTGPPDPHDRDNIVYFHSLQSLRAQHGVEEEVCFVYESGPTEGEPFTIPLAVVADLYRVADVMFMPSHREGFGMPVLEAGLAGVPVVATDVIPAAVEIGGQNIMQFSPHAPPESLASKMIVWLETQPTFQLRRRVRQQYTWQAIFRRDIEPLLQTQSQ